jgi:hypothetical protein
MKIISMGLFLASAFSLIFLFACQKIPGKGGGNLAVNLQTIR